jgi:hypothetical protein
MNAARNRDSHMKTRAKAFFFIFLLSVIFCGAALASASSPVYADTSQLNIVVEPVSHLSDCVQTSEVARGDSIPFLINVTYSATGKIMSNGTVQVHVSSYDPLKARYSSGTKLWTAVYNVAWNQKAGPLDYFVTALSADGASGIWKPINPYGLITVVPTNLHVTLNATDPSTGKPVYTASPGDTIKIVASVALPLPGEGSPTQSPTASPDVAGAGQPLNDTTASEVQAVIGQGTFNATSGTFSEYTAPSIKLAYDPTISKWIGSYTFKQSDRAGLYTVIVSAADRVNQPNVGYSTGDSLTLEPKNTGGLDTQTVLVASFGMIVLGFIAGLIVISKFALPKH